MSESSTDKKYVHDGVEVVKTGRIAKREQAPMRASRRAAPTPSVLHEITPADKESGSWKKWVRETDLYEIVE